MFCTVGLASSAFSVYQPYLIVAGGLNNTQGSTIFTVRSLFSLISMLFVERFYRRAELRLGMAIAAVCAALSFALYGLSNGFAGYCAAAIFSGFAHGLGGVAPLSIMLHRWFRSHATLAVGLGATGSGIATIVAPPIVTALIARTSLRFTFLAESAFVALASAIVFAMLRNRPEEKGIAPLLTKEDALSRTEDSPGAGRGVMFCMMAAVLLIGAVSNAGFQHLPILYTTEGFSGMTVSFIFSFAGIVLTAAKIIYGHVTDRLGAYKSGFIFFSLFVLGMSLCCLAGVYGIAVALAAMFCLSLGIPLSTVGLSVFAKDMAPADAYGKAVKNFQLVYMIGALLCGPIPGIMADATGSYIPSYIFMSALTLVSMALVQGSYGRIGRPAVKPDR
jgi:predicted MFS family arabinose efflux permease